MPVLALITEAFGSRGGLQEFNRHWLRALASSDRQEAIDVLVTGGGDHQADNIRQRHRVGRLAYLGAAWRSAGHLGESDLIVCGHLALMPVAALASRRSGAPVWLQLHGIEAWDPPSSLVRRALESVRLVTAVSRYTRRRFLAWCGIEPGRVRILPNTLRLDCLDPGAADSGAQRQPFRLLSVGRLNASEGYKGHDRVIQALPRVVRAFPQVEYLIAGDGDDRPRLEALVHSLQLSERVRFLGQVTRERLLGLYRSSGLFVMPSTGEGFGIVFLEALACGCPVLGLGEDGSADPLSLPGAAALGDAPLAETLVRLLGSASARPDRQALEARFGPEVFRKQVHWMLDRLHP